MEEKGTVSEEKREKEESVKLKLAISILSFLTIFIAEIYIIINMGSDVNSITLFAIMSLIAAYFVIDSLMFLSELKSQRLGEQYKEICDAQKASYIVLNNSFEEINDRLSLLEKIMKISTEEMINAQKGTSKVIINRNKDNTEAILESYVKLAEQLERTEEMQTEKLSVLDEISETTVTDVNKQMELHMQQLMVQMKDMELRLNQVIMQNSKVVVSAAPIEMAISNPIENVVQTSEEVSSVELSDVLETLETEDTIISEHLEKDENRASLENLNQVEYVETAELLNQEEHVETTELLNQEEHVEISEILNEVEDMQAEQLSSFAEMENDELLSEDTDSIFKGFVLEEPIIEEEQEIEVVSDIQVEEPMLEIKESIMPELRVEEPPTDESIPEDITMTEVSAEGADIEPIKEELVKEEKPPMPDLSNPNKIMSADEIAALLANMGEEPEVEPIKEEKPPMPDLSNPNKIMSADEIAALLANMGEEPEVEPIKEEKPPMPDLSNPNKVMTPDEIAALIANL